MAFDFITAIDDHTNMPLFLVVLILTSMLGVHMWFSVYVGGKTLDAASLLKGNHYPFH